jgi:hypothetical protein
MNKNKKTARFAGLLYLLLIVFGVFAQVIREKLIVWGDATKTADNIMASSSLFRLSFISDLIMIMCFIFLPLVLYKLLKSVNKTNALLMAILALISIPVMFVNMLFHFAAILLTSGANYLTVFSTNQLNSMAMFSLDFYTTGVMITTIFHGLWLFPLGYLVYKSGYFPKVLGIFLMIACFGFVIESFAFFVLPESYVWITYPGIVFEILGEFGFMFWLLIKGKKIST